MTFIVVLDDSVLLKANRFMLSYTSKSQSEGMSWQGLRKEHGSQS